MFTIAEAGPRLEGLKPVNLFKILLVYLIHCRGRPSLRGIETFVVFNLSINQV